MNELDDIRNYLNLVQHVSSQMPVEEAITQPQSHSIYSILDVMKELRDEDKPVFKQKMFESVIDYHRFLLSPKENAVDKLHNCRRHPLKQYSTILEDTTSTKEARQFANSVMNLSSPIQLVEGGKLSLIHTMAMPDNKLIDIYGFTNPKTIEKIFHEDDGSIEYIQFDNGDTYPEQGELVNIGGINITNTIMFESQEDAEAAFTKLWFITNNMEGLGWKVTTQLSETVSTGLGGGSAGNNGGQMVGGPTTYEQENDMFKSKGPRRLMSMTETLESSYDYRPGKHDNVFYFDTDNGQQYKVEFGRAGKAAEVALYARGNGDEHKTSITGTGNAGKVFGTVVNIVKDYVAKNKIMTILFTANNNQPSRVKLYNTLASRVSKVLPDYKYVGPMKNGNFTQFTLKHNNAFYNPTIDKAKQLKYKALDAVFEDAVTLNQLYGDDKPDRHDTIWDYGTMIWDTPFEVEAISPRQLDMYLCDQYGVEHVEDLFDRMSEEQHEIVDHYINDPQLSNKVIVLDNGYIVDGNHRAIAAVLTKRPIKYVNIGEEDEPS